MNKISRTLFWFEDENEVINELVHDFLGLGTLLNRLLNEKYTGKKIQFINLDFSTPENYNRFPSSPKEEPHYYGGHLRYYGVFDLEEFSNLNWKEKTNFVWEHGCKNLIKSAKIIGNTDLLEAVQYAYKKGLKIDLNPDYQVVETTFELNGEKFTAAVWINFKRDGMYSKLTVENNDKIVFEKDLQGAENGTEFFLDMYKGIEFKNNVIIIKGPKDAGLPLKIPFKFPPETA